MLQTAFRGVNLTGTGCEIGCAAREGGEGNHTLWSQDLEDQLILPLFREELSESQ